MTVPQRLAGGQFTPEPGGRAGKNVDSGGGDATC